MHNRIGRKGKKEKKRKIDGKEIEKKTTTGTPNRRSRAGRTTNDYRISIDWRPNGRRQSEKEKKKREGQQKKREEKRYRIWIYSQQIAQMFQVNLEIMQCARPFGLTGMWISRATLHVRGISRPIGMHLESKSANRYKLRFIRNDRVWRAEALVGTFWSSFQNGLTRWRICSWPNP